MVVFIFMGIFMVGHGCLRLAACPLMLASTPVTMLPYSWSSFIKTGSEDETTSMDRGNGLGYEQ